MWQFLLPALGSVLGGLAGGRAQGRQSAAQTNLQRDQLATQQYGTQQNALIQALLAAENANMGRANLDLNRRQFQLSAPGQRGQNAVRGDMMANAQDVSISHPRATLPQISGGMRPSMLSGNTRALGQDMSRQALLQQLKGDNFEDVPQQNWGGAVLKPPSQTPLPQGNWFDKFLGVAAPIAAIGGAFGQAAQDSESNAWLKQLLQQPTAAGNMAQPLPMPPGWRPQQGQLQPQAPIQPYMGG